MYVARFKRTGIGWDERVVREEGFRGVCVQIGVVFYGFEGFVWLFCDVLSAAEVGLSAA